ncbi:protein of unknown function [Methylorubrum extorquens]|uniref:Uncharacterized protein n=1 Tax=Methylorubrum extorquens TaxID=408 RepID=A0A2N9AJY2_METEX|nr:protein of unknown function [Methylorubrum extorquens]
MPGGQAHWHAPLSAFHPANWCDSFSANRRAPVEAFLAVWVILGIFMLSQRSFTLAPRDR